MNQSKQELSCLSPYILLTTSRDQVENAIKDLPACDGIKLLLIDLNRRRNPKNNCSLFPGVALMSKTQAKSKDTVRRRIRKAEAAGYLYVEDRILIKDGCKPQAISNKYYFTALLLDPLNEKLRTEILSEPMRASKINAAKKSSIQILIESRRVKIGSKTPHSGRKATIVYNHSFKRVSMHTPLCKNAYSELIKVNNGNINITTKTTKQSSPKETKPDVVVFKSHIPSPIKSKPSPERRDQAKEILTAYESAISKPSVKQSKQFIAEYISSNHNLADLKEAVVAMAECPILKSTTHSPMRLFFKEGVISQRDMMIKKARKAFKEAYDPQMTLDRLKMDESIWKWFLFDEKKVDHFLMRMANEAMSSGY